MATEVKIKRKLSALSADREGPVNFFVHKEDCKDEMSSDDDTTDSDESIFSGQEEESDTSEESEDSEDLSSHEDTTNETDDDDDDDPSSSSKTNKKNSRTEGKANNNINIIKKSVITDGHSSTSVTDNTNHNDDEYDSSDEEDIRNTVGNIPLKWYEEFRHIGYDLDARKLIKPKKDDELDNFLNKMDDPDYLRTVTNKYTGQKVVLSEADVDLIKRIQKNKHFNPNEDLYKPWVDFFSSEERIHPVTNQPAHKRSFIPSKWEKVRVGQMVNAIRLGWWKPKPRNQGPEEEEYYQLWKDEEEQEINKRYRHHIPAPKLPLPGHAESYNPPPEYLFTPEEKEMWEKQKPEKRQLNFIPQKYSSLRLVPGYRNFIRERFERCLDLYLCPRQRKMRVRDLDPQDLLPKLPKPKDLQPFPSVQAVIYKGHTDMVRCISVHPQGQWLVSGSDDHMVKLWEVSTGRCMKTLRVEGTVKSIAWNPNTSLCLFALVVDLSVIIINPGLLDKLIVSATDNIINSYVDIPADEDSPKKKPVPVKWQMYDGEDYQAGFRIQIIHPKEVRQVTWHAKGDYFAIVMPHADRFSVLIHQLSKRRTQNPFSKKKGLVQCILFHPIKPVLLVATQRYVRMYNLLRQELIKKLMANCRWISSLAVHSGGDNVIIGSYDSKLNWFDMDLSAQPYQTLRHHKKAIRQVCFHKRYPLFASASDDCSVIVCHGMVYSDLLMNPLIVPVKILRGHAQARDLGVLDCQFHPYQPWIFSSGSDATIRLYT